MTEPTIQETVREEVKAYMDAMFRNPVMLDTLASAMLSRAVAALNYRAHHSTQRMPTLVVSENRIPGAIRVQLGEDGSLLAEEALADPIGDVEQWEKSKSVMDDELVSNSVKELVLSYGGVAGKFYYVIDDISLETYRKSLSDRVSERVQQQIPGEPFADTDDMVGQAPSENV